MDNSATSTPKAKRSGRIGFQIMADLLLKPFLDAHALHQLPPNLARSQAGCEDWKYVGFSAHRLKAGEALDEGMDTTSVPFETIVVLIEGKATVTIDGQAFGEQGDRLDVFEKKPPVALYVPVGAALELTATTDCEVGLCRALVGDDPKHYPAGPIGNIGSEVRGEGTNTRHIHPIAMEDNDVANQLLVTEVFTPAGNWSSYFPHRHDEDDFPNMTYLEETYYHRLRAVDGSTQPGLFGVQRVFTEDGSLDETMAVGNRDLVLVPRGHHPCAAPYGIEMYYLNVMAGPLRKWRFKAHPDFEFLTQSVCS